MPEFHRLVHYEPVFRVLTGSAIDPCLITSFALVLAASCRDAGAAGFTSDHGGDVSEYKAKHEQIRDRHERVMIDGICNSACTPLSGIVPLSEGFATTNNDAPCAVASLAM